MIDLIYNRAQADVTEAARILSKITVNADGSPNLGGLTADELSAYYDGFVGAYNCADMNRVSYYTDRLRLALEAAGYAVGEADEDDEPLEPTSRLPEGYVEVEYIQSSGTQYIDTEFKPKGSSRIVMEVEPTDISANATFFCARNAVAATDSGANVLFWVPGSTGYRFDYYGASNAISATLAAGTRLQIDQNAGALKINNYSTTITRSTSISPEAWLLLASGSATTTDVTNYLKARLYACRIWDAGTLVRNFVPCISPGGAVGLYDLVNAQFYANSGSGVFTAGRRVYAFSEYTVLDSIESTGTQWIDTGITPDVTTETDISWQITSAAGTAEHSIFGASWSISGYFLAAYAPAGGFRWHSRGVQVDIATDALAKHKAVCTTSGIDFDGNYYPLAQAVSQDSALPIMLFSTSGSVIGGRGIYRLFYCQIYDDSTLVRDFVPVRHPEGDIGLYDRVEGRFYGNSGSGEFIAGEEVGSGGIPQVYDPLPSDVTRLAWMEAGASNYGTIDTGIVATNNTRIELAFRRIPNNRWYGTFVGARQSSQSQFVIYYKTQQQITFRAGTSSGAVTVTTEGEPTMLHHVDFSAERVIFDGVTTEFASPAEFDTATTIALFGEPGMYDYIVGARIYSCRIWDGETLVRDLVPAYIDKPGFYDLVTGDFLTSSSNTIVGGTALAPLRWPFGHPVRLDDWRSYIGGVAALVNAFYPLGTPELPKPSATFDYVGANALEETLALLERGYDNMVAAYRLCGTFTAGENTIRLPLRR